jgi:hypothetical protein
MSNKVKDVVSTIGDETGVLAKRFGCATADLAGRVAGETVDLAKRVGPKRGLIGLAIAAAAVGGTIVLVRYLRARDPEERAEDIVAHRAARSPKRAAVPMPH